MVGKCLAGGQALCSVIAQALGCFLGDYVLVEGAHLASVLTGAATELAASHL